MNTHDKAASELARMMARIDAYHAHQKVDTFLVGLCVGIVAGYLLHYLGG